MFLLCPPIRQTQMLQIARPLTKNSRFITMVHVHFAKRRFATTSARTLETKYPGSISRTRTSRHLGQIWIRKPPSDDFMQDRHPASFTPEAARLPRSGSTFRGFMRLENSQALGSWEEHWNTYIVASCWSDLLCNESCDQQAISHQINCANS